MHGTKSIMIVDDEAIVALNIKGLLEQHGYTASVINTGELCLDQIRSGQVPDLILMDINLGSGRISGPETTRRIHRSYPDIPVILHSAYTDRETIQGTRNMTKYGYVHKVPGNEEFVLATVEMAFKLQERERMYRDLSAHVNRMREEQNAFIAREIHDDLGQSIAALKMNLTILARSVKNHDAGPIISDMREILDDTALKVRSLIHELRPPVLDTADIVEALRWHGREFEKTFLVPVTVACTLESVELEPEQSLSVFRVVQEALTNAARHGEPSRIVVSISRDGELLTVTITDDGVGFDADRRQEPRSFGILGMQERAEQWGGYLSLHSTPGDGTTVKASFPIRRKGAGETP